MTKGKVVLVPFPFDDLSATKVSPAVCLSDPIGPNRHVLLAFITSQVPSPLLPTDVVISSRDAAFSRTGLRVTSVVRLHRLMTVTVSLVRRQLGKLSPSLQAEMTKRLVQMVS